MSDRSEPGGHLGDALSALADGELTPDEANAARAHLASCPKCSADLDSLDRVRARLRDLPLLDPHLGADLDALADGELTPVEAAYAAGHLERCAECRTELEAIERTRDQVRSLPPVEPPLGALALPGRSRAPRRGRRAVAHTAVAAHRGLAPVFAGAAAVVAVLGLLVGPRSPGPARPSVPQLVAVHAQSAPGADPVSGLATVAVPVSLGR